MKKYDELLKTIKEGQKIIEVKTGYGYFTKNGTPTDKATLPIGFHRVSDEYDYVDVPDEETLNNFEVAEPELELTEEEQIELKIRMKMRELAVLEIKKEDPNFEDPESENIKRIREKLK